MGYDDSETRIIVVGDLEANISTLFLKADEGWRPVKAGATVVRAGVITVDEQLQRMVPSM